MYYVKKFEKEMAQKFGKTYFITRLEAYICYDHLAHIFYVEPTSFRKLPIYLPFSSENKKIVMVLKKDQWV